MIVVGFERLSDRNDVSLAFTALLVGAWLADALMQLMQLNHRGGGVKLRATERAARSTVAYFRGRTQTQDELVKAIQADATINEDVRAMAVTTGPIVRGRRSLSTSRITPSLCVVAELRESLTGTGRIDYEDHNCGGQPTQLIRDAARPTTVGGELPVSRSGVSLLGPAPNSPPDGPGGLD